jgi:hypothetical protein
MLLQFFYYIFKYFLEKSKKIEKNTKNTKRDLIIHKEKQYINLILKIMS